MVAPFCAKEQEMEFRNEILLEQLGEDLPSLCANQYRTAITESGDSDQFMYPVTT